MTRCYRNRPRVSIKERRIPPRASTIWGILGVDQTVANWLTIFLRACCSWALYGASRRAEMAYQSVDDVFPINHTCVTRI